MARAEKKVKEAAPRARRAKKDAQVETAASEAGEGSTAAQATVTATDTAAEAATPSSTRSVVDRSKYGYVTHKDVKTTSGRAAVDNDDAVAKALRGLTADQVYEVLTNSGGEISEKWGHLNVGMRRMSAGNVIRRIFNEGKPITLLDGSVIQGEAKPKAEPKRKAKAPKAAATEAEPEAPAEVQAEA